MEVMKTEATSEYHDLYFPVLHMTAFHLSLLIFGTMLGRIGGEVEI